MSIKNTLKEIIIKAIEDYKIDLTLENIIIQDNIKEKCFISNIAILISNIIAESPNIIAETIKNKLNNSKIIDNVIITDEGNIKIFIKKEYLFTYINTIIEKKNKYGKNNIGKNKKINIKFKKDLSTTINNLSEIRKIIYCDNISRILNYCNYDVTKDYYLSNNINFSNNIDNNLLISNIKKELDEYRIYFEKYTIEKELYDEDVIENLLTTIRYSKYCYINNDGMWLKTTSSGDLKDRLLIDEEGNYTSFVINLAYYIDKINKGYYSIIDFLPNNDKKIFQISLRILEKNPNILKIKNEGIVNVTNSNKNNLKDLITKIGINELRYFFSIYNIKDNINMDISTFLENKKDNPYYYIEKEIILLSSILRKERNNNNITKYNTLTSDISYNIVYKLAIFEDIIIDSYKKMNPFIIAEYAYELASLFNDFYKKESIIDNNEKLNLLLAIKIILNNSLDLIGIIPREEI